MVPSNNTTKTKFCHYHPEHCTKQNVNVNRQREQWKCFSEYAIVSINYASYQNNNNDRFTDQSTQTIVAEEKGDMTSSGFKYYFVLKNLMNTIGFPCQWESESW